MVSGLADVQHVATAQRASGLPAKLPQDERGFAAQVIRHLYATAYRQISAAAVADGFAKLQYGTGLDDN